MKRVGVVPKGGGLSFFLLPMIDREPTGISNTKPDYRACEDLVERDYEEITKWKVQHHQTSNIIY